MKTAKKYLALFLLLVISFTAAPAPLLHNLLADHTDAAENHCRFYHKDLGCHIEEQQEHCDIFKTNTPLYDAIALAQDFTCFPAHASPHKRPDADRIGHAPILLIPARAPPIS